MAEIKRPAETHVVFIDHLRGVAILLVFLVHSFLTLGLAEGIHFLPTFANWQQAPAWTWPLFPLSLGWGGVALFFVISGFCIHLSHVKSRDKRFSTFFTRRFFRIYPPYLLTLLFFALILPFTRLTFEKFHDYIIFGSHLFLLHNFDARSILRINGVYWSLAVEFQLYLIYPFLLWLVHRTGWNKCLGLLLVFGILFLKFDELRSNFIPWIPPLFDGLKESPLSYWFCWAIGAKIADDWLENRTIFLSNFPALPFFVAFVACSVTESLFKLDFIIASVLAAIVIGRILVNPASVIHWKICVFNEPMRKVGMVSYSLYLIHLPFIVMTEKLIGKSPVTFMVCLLELPLIYLLASGFYRLVELPSINLGKRILERNRLPS